MKEKKKGKKNTKLMGDGLPRMLSGDGFYEQVVKFTEWQQQQVEEAGRKADARTAWKEAVKEWEAKNAEIDAAKEELKTEVAAWTKMKNAARAKKTRFSIPKPQRDIEKKAPKPTLKSFIAAAKKSLEQENVHGDDEAELSDGESDRESDEDDEDDD
ncbi:hypothetical protein CC1G_08555 [Coprinopsis cinerea okayama7|uniref:Uncharacterized protein n=1 Tax=Coprinopsis cinerea (strain Okayama-7 / 130 / ATCC MYA-4618 / FGSC 9003) TaxID=240176 RepID=A8ND87_COPC7|nr:hypothetical protein CC1G_08555 [Coprinopsis cinerea okayama7\|eukprot:XP_001832727.1 hypothetical protein CC1G_08555 [Coprinopsis cinerea okayama7\